MTFTYNTNPFDNVARVRFWTGDVDVNRAIFQDEVINGVIQDQGTWQTAAVVLIQNIIMQLSGQPDFHADWLTVDYKTALQYYSQMIIRVARQLGVPYSPIASAVNYTYRADSAQTQQPNYPQDGPGGGSGTGSLPNWTG